MKYGRAKENWAGRREGVNAERALRSVKENEKRFLEQRSVKRGRARQGRP